MACSLACFWALESLLTRSSFSCLFLMMALFISPTFIVRSAWYAFFLSTSSFILCFEDSSSLIASEVSSMPFLALSAAESAS